jgi:hypothetical protein
MELGAAKQRVLSLWKEVVDASLGCEVDIDDKLTKTYRWGWVFYLVPRQPEQCSRKYQLSAFAFYLPTGETMPVGTKGLEHALKVLRSREKKE